MTRLPTVLNMRLDQFFIWSDLHLPFCMLCACSHLLRLPTTAWQTSASGTTGCETWVSDPGSVVSPCALELESSCRLPETSLLSTGRLPMSGDEHARIQGRPSFPRNIYHRRVSQPVERQRRGPTLDRVRSWPVRPWPGSWRARDLVDGTAVG